MGHPAVYSDAVPYVDTDLACGRVTPNDAASWAGRFTHDLHRRRLGDGGRRRRTPCASSATCGVWPPSAGGRPVQAARLDEPVDAGRLFSELDRARALARDRVARARWRLRQRRLKAPRRPLSR